jgi:hypothetical protein
MKYTIALFLGLSFSYSAHAAVLVEPIVGYLSQSTKCTLLNGTDCKSKETGPLYGARLGYMAPMGLWAALEYDASSGKSKPQVGTKSDYTYSSTGITVGADISFFRVFAGYGFMNKGTFKSPGSSANELTGGSVVKIGAGYKFPVLPLAINVEMDSIEFKKFESSGMKFKVKDVFSTLKSNALIVTISAPFSF